MNEYMRVAFDEARAGMRLRKGGPFGAAIVKDGEILGAASNEVLATNDPTAHAEMLAIRRACRLDRFVFSAEGLQFGIRTLERLRSDPAIGTLFLDEAGPLELQGQGFAGVLPQMLRAEKKLYIAVRSNCLPEFLQKFEIAEYRLIQEPETSPSPSKLFKISGTFHSAAGSGT